MNTQLSTHSGSRSLGQRGAALVMTAIMLVLLTLLVLAVINMSTVNLRVANNEQTRQESIAAAQRGIEQVVSTNFPGSPAPLSITVDIDGNGSTDYNVAVAKPVCQNSVPIKSNELDINNAGDQQCFCTALMPCGAGNNSLCANTQWDIPATATNARDSAQTVTVHQGVGQRVLIGTTC
jgi:Tfp pilus assembly protein PilX